MKRLKGFMGYTHTVLSLCILLVFTMLPQEIFQTTFGRLKDSPLNFIMCIILFSGAVLLVDLDSDKSTAQAYLGPLGVAITVFMQSTSMIIWNVTRTKRDRQPPSQHRYFWHSPIIWIAMTLLFYFTLPTGKYSIINNLMTSAKYGELGLFFMTNTTILLFIFMSILCSFVGSIQLVSKFGKYLYIPKWVKYILPFITLIYVFSVSYDSLAIMGLCMGVGALLHCLEDAFCDSGLPSLIFPIPNPFTKRMWSRISFLPKGFTITTGGTVNKIIDFLASGVLVLLIIKLILGGGKF